MRRLITKAIDRVLVREVRGDAGFSIFDEVVMVKLLKGLRGYGGATLCGES